MKRLHCRFLLLILITSVSLQAQEKIIYSKAFTADAKTTVLLNLENTTVALETSNDGKVHFDYVMDFNNYSKKEMEQLLKNIKVDATAFDNTITLYATSDTAISETAYQLEAPFGITFDDLLKPDSSKTTIKRKSKETLIKEMADASKGNLLEKLEVLDKDGQKKRVDLKKIKMYHSRFVIQVPPFVRLKIVGKTSRMTLLDPIINEMSLNLRKGSFKAKSISNVFNKFQIKDADFEVETLSGGDFQFDHVTRGTIGSIQNLKIVSEFSKFEIGEIQEKVSITDYNGDYKLYHWAKDFKRFDLFSEYTTLYLFYPEQHDFSLSVIGNNTVSHFGNMVVTMQPTKTDRKFNMMERKAKGEGHFSGAIHIDMVRGILHTSERTFIKSE